MSTLPGEKIRRRRHTVSRISCGFVVWQGRHGWLQPTNQLPTNHSGIMDRVIKKKNDRGWKEEFNLFITLTLSDEEWQHDHPESSPSHGIRDPPAFPKRWWKMKNQTLDFLPKFCFSREKQGFLSFKGEGHIFDKIFTVIFRGQIKLHLMLNDV